MERDFYDYKKVEYELLSYQLIKSKDTQTMNYWIKPIASKYSFKDLETMENTLLNYKELALQKQNQMVSLLAVCMTMFSVFVAVLIGALSITESIDEVTVTPSLAMLIIYIVFFVTVIAITCVNYRIDSNKIADTQTTIRLIRDFKEATK